MAREYAKVFCRLWADDNWRALSVDAHALYIDVLTHPSMSYAGVMDWRPSRLRRSSSDWTEERFDAATFELEQALFIVVDEETDEALVRSFIRNDGVLKVPNMAVAMLKAYGEIASPDVRGVVVHELLRLREELPDLAGWLKAGPLLANPSIDPKERALIKGSVDPSVKGSVDPSVNPKPMPSVTPATATTPIKQQPKRLKDGGQAEKRATRISSEWQPTPEAIEVMQTECPNIDLRSETANFVDHFLGKGGKEALKVDWLATWRGWIRRQAKWDAERNRPQTRPSRRENTMDAWGTPSGQQMQQSPAFDFEGEVIELRGVR